MMAKQENVLYSNAGMFTIYSKTVSSCASLVATTVQCPKVAIFNLLHMRSSLFTTETRYKLYILYLQAAELILFILFSYNYQ